MKVIVIGAGIGGLALAQGLRRAGVDVTVHDRDHDVAATGGYRLHLDAIAAGALRRLVPPDLHHALLASAAHPGSVRHFAMLDARLRPLVVEPRAPGEDSLMIGRIPLRRLLARGLDVRWGAEHVGFARVGDGVIARFADGSTDRGDLLVGADGVGSRVAAALAGRPTARALGVSGIAGRTPLTAEVRALLPDALHAGPGLALGPGATIAFLSLHDPTVAAVEPVEGAEIEPPNLVWGLTLPTHRLPAGPDPAGRVAAAWQAPLPALVTAADPASVATFRFSAADPDADLTPWPSGPVTAIGDAVHAMPPTGGRAAATAIRDADLLVRELATGAPLPVAVHAYERAMPGYAVDAVRVSLAPLRWMGPLGLPGAHHLAAGALRVAGLVGRAR